MRQLRRTAADSVTVAWVRQHIPTLLARARVLIGLKGGPADALARSEIRRAAAAVLRLHAGLVGDRALARPETYQGELLGAYLLWWWPQTYLKTQAALRLAPMPRAPRILDVGSGPAPAALAARDLLGGEATCFDLSAPALAEARALGVQRTVHELPAEYAHMIEGNLRQVIGVQSVVPILAQRNSACG